MNRQASSRRYYEKNKEEIKAKTKIYRDSHKTKIKEYNQKYKQQSAERRLYYAAKDRARLKGLDFNLELSDIIIPELCPYLKTPLTMKTSNEWTNPSLDRIDNTLGYIKGNIEVISRLANIMKAHSSKQELVIFAKSVLERFDT